MVTILPTAKKPVEWVASSKDDLSAMPEDVKMVFGQAIFEAQIGGKHPDDEPLKGKQFPGTGVLEIVEDCDGDTYRAVYTVKFEGVIYVLHAFQKKSVKGIETPKREIELVLSRLKYASKHYEQNYKARNSA
jgi:phage-related protein